VLAAAGCAGEGPLRPAPKLVEPGDTGRQSFGLRLTTRGMPYLFGGFSVCLNRSGVVSVTGVEFEDATGDLRVQAFALRPFYRAFGDDGVGWGEPKSLKQRGVPTALRTVTQVCQPDDSSRVEFTELVLQTSRPGAVSASSSGFVISYTSGASEGRLRVPFGITLCAPADKTLPLCQSQT
jgi:hypothetical protein